jgi:hypothetical protein
VGVTEVVLAVNYKPEVMLEALDAIATEVGVKITCSQETEPLGTAGPLALAREHLDDGEPFFVFNSDVTCTYPLAELLAFHKAHGREGTIFVTKVAEPSKYGVVVHDADGEIKHFVEKPQTFVGNHINAGLYIFNPSIFDRIPLRPTSIEKEIFPAVSCSFFSLDWACCVSDAMVADGGGARAVCNAPPWLLDGHWAASRLPHRDGSVPVGSLGPRGRVARRGGEHRGSGDHPP